MYNTKWIVIENKTQKAEFTHYKGLDGDKIIVSVYETKTGCGDISHTDFYTKADANDFYRELISLGWKVTKNEFV